MSWCKVLKCHHTVWVRVKVTWRVAESRAGIFNHILNIIDVISWPRFMRVADRSLAPVSSLWDRRHTPASMDGEFMKRETRTWPRFSHGDEMVIKRLPFSGSLQVTSMLLKTKSPNSSLTYKQYFLLLWLLSFPNVKLLIRHVSFWPHLWEDRYLAGMMFLSQMENLGHKEVRMNFAHLNGRIEVRNRVSRIWVDWICQWQSLGCSKNWIRQDDPKNARMRSWRK